MINELSKDEPRSCLIMAEPPAKNPGIKENKSLFSLRTMSYDSVEH